MIMSSDIYRMKNIENFAHLQKLSMIPIIQKVNKHKSYFVCMTPLVCSDIYFFCIPTPHRWRKLRVSLIFKYSRTFLPKSYLKNSMTNDQPTTVSITSAMNQNMYCIECHLGYLVDSFINKVKLIDQAI